MTEPDWTIHCNVYRAHLDTIVQKWECATRQIMNVRRDITAKAKMNPDENARRNIFDPNLVDTVTLQVMNAQKAVRHVRKAPFVLLTTTLQMME